MNKALISLTTFALIQLLPLASFAQMTCEKVFHIETKTSSKKVSKFTEKLAGSLRELKSWDDVYTAKTKPTWEDYQTLATLISKLETQLTAKGQTQLPSHEIEYLKAELQAWALPYHRMAKKLSERPLAEEEINFIDRNYAFFKLQQRVNELVGLNVFPDYYIKQVPPDTALIEQGTQTVSNLKAAQGKLLSTTGYKNPSELRKALKNHSKAYSETLNMVDDKLVIAIHRPENARFWIPLAGFQNQRVTGSSNGSFNPDYRNQVESQLTFQNTETYSKQSVRYMPNYGEVRPEAGTTLFEPNTGADRYGSDLWIVKKSLYESRASWTPRDSFGQPRVPNFEAATSWDHMFVPWTSRELMVPYAVGDKTDIRGSRFTPGVTGAKFPLKGHSYGSNYFEAQIWGPLSLNDIEAFHFKVNPPSRELYDLLISKGIKVYDERTLPAKIYTFEAE
ncbi:MAG: hypothetical protein JSU04_13340 [Bdellovibrionales bacterium]|nr:hypothetical protein [Bdellovibrionales bacterium]